MTRATRRSPERVRTAHAAAGRIEVASAGGCVTATLEWPAARKRDTNKLTAAMALRLIELAEEVEDDADALMLVIRGAGGNFCAGFDDDVDSMAPGVVESIAVLSKPTLAIIDGLAADEGMELALAADLRVAAQNARFTMGQLGRVAGEVVRAITSRGPVAARLAKEAVRKGCDLTLDQGIRLEEDLYALLQTTADRAEGVRAFLDKRKPLFRGT